MYTDWVIPIHDAFIVHPNDVAHVKGIYTDGLKEVYEKRAEILNTFFTCIGIDKQYPEHYQHIEDFQPLTACLK